MDLPAFELHQPTSIEEAVALARDHLGEARFLAGGSDLLPNMKFRMERPGHLIALSRIRALARVEGTRLGAMARLGDLERRRELQHRMPGLWEAVQSVASPVIRATATLGGNLMLQTRCHFYNQSEWWRSSVGHCLKDEQGDLCLVTGKTEGCVATFSGDLAPVLLVYGADIEVCGPAGTRRMALSDLYRNDGLAPTVLAGDELITAVLVSPERLCLRTGYRKLRLRDSIDFPLIGVAAGLVLDAKGAIAELEVSVTAAASCPLVFSQETAALRGQAPDDALLQDLASAISAKVQPVRNVFLSVVYRKKMVGVLLKRLLTDLRAQCRTTAG